MRTRLNVEVTRNKSLTFYILDCWNCGVPFGLTNDYDDRRRDDCRTFYCPNGHPQSYSESEADRLRRELDAAREATAEARRQLAATKGQVTKLKRRAQNGVCPCCHRHFVALERHMSTKHPDYAAPDHD